MLQLPMLSAILEPGMDVLKIECLFLWPIIGFFLLKSGNF